MLIENATIHPIEIKAGTNFNSKNIKAFSCLDNLSMPLGEGVIICNCEKQYPISDTVWAYPLGGL